MWKHIICFKFKDRSEAPKVKVMLEGMMGKIPTLRSIECGVDIYASARSFDLVLITTFDDEVGYHAYDVHPEHNKVREYIHSVRETSVAIDYKYNA